MSRVAKAPVTLPSNVEFKVEKGSVSVKGPKGTLNQHYNKLVKIKHSSENNEVSFEPASKDPKAWAHAGTARALVNNMVKGVTDGFEKTLELIGVGYRAQAKGSSITLNLGFSHPVEYSLPEGVTVETPNATTVVLKSIDNQRLGQVASEIRSFRPPEPYKGKGVKYADETVVRKEAKKK